MTPLFLERALDAAARGVDVEYGPTRRFSYSVRMFVELSWLLDAGFVDVTFYDGEGKRLTAQGRRMITISRR